MSEKSMYRESRPTQSHRSPTLFLCLHSLYPLQVLVWSIHHRNPGYRFLKIFFVLLGRHETDFLFDSIGDEHGRRGVTHDANADNHARPGRDALIPPSSALARYRKESIDHERTAKETLWGQQRYVDDGRLLFRKLARQGSRGRRCQARIKATSIQANEATTAPPLHLLL